jgi:hypothetical protein
MRNRLIFAAIFIAASAVTAVAQVQTIQPGDSLEARRQKENSSLQYLNSRYSSLNQLAHSHANKSVLDTIPALFGAGNRILGTDANGTSFEFKSFVAGAGITISHSAGQATISLIGGGGITSLNGLTGSTQAFGNDANLSIISAGTLHQLTWLGLLPASRGGTNNGSFQVTGPAGSLKTFTFPNANAKVLTDAAPVSPSEGGTGVAGALDGVVIAHGTSPATAAPMTGTGSVAFSISASLTTPQIQTTAEFRAQAQARFFAPSGSNYVGFRAPDSLSANTVWKLPASDGASGQVMATDAGGNLTWITPPGSGVGEANTASNVGAGAGLFKQKVSADLQFKSLLAASNKVAVTGNTNEVTVDVNEANLNVANLGGTVPVAKGGTGGGSFTGLLVGNGTSPFTTKAAPSGNIVGDSDPAILTNKTLDAEAAGNVVLTTSRLWIDAAGVEGGSASSNWDLPTANAPTAAAVVGANTIKGVLDFPDGSSDLTAQRTIALPADFTGAVDVTFKWFSPVTTGTAVLGVAAACAGDGALDDPAFNSFSDVMDQARASANQLNDATLTNINMTGCSGGKLMHLKIARRLSQSADTLNGAVRLVGVEVTLRRAQ